MSESIITKHKTAHLYARYSTKIQAKGHSKQRQLQSFHSYVAETNMSIGNVYVDDGTSAFKSGIEHRPALNQLLDDRAKGLISDDDLVCIEGFDRLSRNQVADAVRLLLDILATGINIITLNDRMVFTNPPDMIQLMVSILHLSRAHSESEAKSMRLSAVWTKKLEDARNGKVVTRQVPKWISVQGNGDSAKYVLNDHAPTIKRMFNLCIAGYGVLAICKELNNEGILSTSGKAWNKTSIRKILRSRAAFGEWEFKGTVLEGYFPAVVNMSTWLRAQKAIDVRKATPDTTKHTLKHVGDLEGSSKPNLFSKLSCGHCNRAFRFVKATHKSNARYRCSGVDIGVCTSKDIKLQQFERRVLAALLEMDWSVDKDTGTTDIELADTIAELEVTNTQIQRTSATIPMLDDPTPVVARLNELNQRKEMLRNKKQELELATINLGADDLIGGIEELADVTDSNFETRMLVAQRVLDVVESFKLTVHSTGIFVNVNLRNGDVRTVTLSVNDLDNPDIGNWLV
ncbi:recombinase family protein [Ferrimonas lipolytica]|uniref:Recombinase family protein n=1 Tax=Ferrimonas lipolytica TaxID=2724191 RepID=A0A6H1UGW0_9GAMM|nr:recombinase family protein [Ferrimonas lipolytica]QIZ78058.1 recombinase family protein [Ferrimonas lipolytica]